MAQEVGTQDQEVAVSTTPVADSLAELLTRAGARLVGRNRADCPSCGGKRTVSWDQSKGAYFCHYLGCDFHGGTYSLARKLGLAHRLSQHERMVLKQRRELARRAASLLAERLKMRRWELYEAHRQLLTIRDNAGEALKRDGENDLALSALAFAYSQLTRVRAELLLLEEGQFSEVLYFLRASPTGRQESLGTIIQAGGLIGRHSKFVELDVAVPGPGA